MRSNGVGAVACVLGLSLSAAPNAMAEEKGPALMKDTLMVATLMREITIKAGKQEKQEKAWAPRMRFRLAGPVASGSAISVDFTLPGGKKLSADYGTAGPIDAGGWVELDRMDYSSVGFPETVGFTTTGEGSFQIKMNNELSGTKAVLYSGKFNVQKVKMPNGSTEYYVDQDWMLPFAYVVTKQYDNVNGADTESAPRLKVKMQFRSDGYNYQAFLFKGGKQVSGPNDGNDTKINISTGETSAFQWTQKMFFFDFEGSTMSEFFAKNPGEYEVKVLHSGKLVRATKFTVDPKGNITDNGLASKGKVANPDIAVLLPVKVTAEAAVKTDAGAWKSAFYGNPIEGFTAP